MRVSQVSRHGDHQAHPFAGATRRLVALVAVVVLSVAACGGGAGDTGTGPSAPSVATVLVTPASATLQVGQRTTLSASPRDASGNTMAGQSVAWSSSDATLATVTDGTVTALAAGSVTIVAAVGTVQRAVTVTITPVPVAAVVITPGERSVLVSQTVQLAASPNDADGAPLTGRTVTWTSSDAALVTVSATGLVTTLAPGAVTITATAEGKSGTATVIVQPVPVASVALTPSTPSLVVGQAVQLSAVVTDSVGGVLAGRAVSWASSDATVATVSPTGLVSTLAPGAATVTATAEGKSAAITIVVQRVPASSVTLTPSAPSLYVGQTVQVSAMVTDAVGGILADRAVTWTSSNPALATVSTTGLVTAVAPGTATVTATAEGKTGSTTIVVQPLPVASVTVTPSAPSLYIGQTVQLATTLKAADNAVLTGRTVTWTSSDVTLATVSSAGLVTARAEGTVTVTATAEGKSGTATIVVQRVPVASVTLTPSTSHLYVGQTVQLAAALAAADGTALLGRAVTWAASDVALATVSSTGLVTTLAAGSVTITATAEGKSGSTTITVERMPVASVTVTPSAPSLYLGQTVQLAATLKAADNTVLTGRTVTWVSSDAALATVSSAGLVTARAAGSVTITATAEGKSGTATIVVQRVPVASVALTASAPSLYVGQTVQLSVVARDADGRTLADPSVTWTSSATNVATVSAEGLVTGVMPGKATITATIESKSASVEIPVETDLVGIIRADTTLSLAGSPYRIRGRVQVAPGVTLTIAPGVVINGDGNAIDVFGHLRATGTSGARIVLRDVHLVPAGTYASPHSMTIAFTDVLGGSLYSLTGGAVTVGTLSLTDSKVKVAARLHVKFPVSDVQIVRNVFEGSVLISVGTDHDVTVSIRNNSFYDTAAIENWASAGTSRTIVEYNSFWETGRIVVSLESGYSYASITAINNFWNTTNDAVVQSMIYDQTDDLNTAGLIPYAPFLTQSDPNTPTGRLPPE